MDGCKLVFVGIAQICVPHCSDQAWIKAIWLLMLNKMLNKIMYDLDLYDLEQNNLRF